MSKEVLDCKIEKFREINPQFNLFHHDERHGERSFRRIYHYPEILKTVIKAVRELNDSFIVVINKDIEYPDSSRRLVLVMILRNLIDTTVLLKISYPP